MMVITEVHGNLRDSAAVKKADFSSDFDKVIAVISPPRDVSDIRKVSSLRRLCH